MDYVVDEVATEYDDVLSVRASSAYHGALVFQVPCAIFSTRKGDVIRREVDAAKKKAAQLVMRGVVVEREAEDEVLASFGGLVARYRDATTGANEASLHLSLVTPPTRKRAATP